jgi:anti-repressor protein
MELITINHNNNFSINARELHEKLEVKSEFRTWIKRAVDKYNFEENIDFQADQNRSPSGQTQKDYYTTVDMAKELCMLDDSDKGRSFRKYFIAKENELKLTKTPQIDSKFLLQIAEEMQRKELLIEQQKTIIDNQDISIEKISNVQDTYSIRETSNRLIMQEKKLIEWLLKKWCQRLSDGLSGKKIYSTSYSKTNRFCVDKAVLNKGRASYYHQCRITHKGLEYLLKNREQLNK